MTMLISEKETKRIAKENLQLNIKDGLIVTFLDGEGVVFEPEMRKSFRINETSIFFLKTLQLNSGGVSLFSVRRLLQERYFVDEDKIIQDFNPFIDQLREYGLVSFQSLPSQENLKEVRAPSSEVVSLYSKPEIDEEVRNLSVTGAAVRAARSAAARSAAVGRATAAGFRGFK